MVRYFVALALALLLLALVPSPPARAQAGPADLPGTWECQADGGTLTLVLGADGAGTFEGEAIRWSANGTRLRLTIEGETQDYEFRLDGDVLVVSGGDLDQPASFKRKGAPRRGLGSRMGGAKPGEAPPSADPGSNPLVGTWEMDLQGRTIVLELGEGGSGTFDAAAMRWSSKEDRLTTTMGDQSRTYGVKVEGDVLTLTQPETGQAVRLRRSAARRAPGVLDGVGGVGAPAPGEGLLGSWRAEDGTVVEFRADGTLAVGGRTAPWVADAGRIVVRGPNGEIAWPYRLMGDVLYLTMEGVESALRRVGSPAPAPPAAGGGLAGKWRDETGQELEITAAEIRIGESRIPFSIRGDALLVTIDGRTMEWPFELRGDRLRIDVNGQPVDLARVGAAGPSPAPAPAPEAAPAAGLVGSWLGPGGFVRVNGDGTVLIDGKPVRYSSDGEFLTLQSDEGWVKIPYKLDGGRLVLGSGPTQTLVRLTGPEGIWSCCESSLDPQFYMAVWQYITLYPDGSVGFEKTESGATRTQVSEQVERFSHWRERRGGQVYGRWTIQGETVTIQWQGAFGNRVTQGRFDSAGNRLLLPGLGILNQGADLAYERK